MRLCFNRQRGCALEFGTEPDAHIIYICAGRSQRTIQDLFEVEAGSGEKVEEFVVLHQEPSLSESIPPHVARPYIQALNFIRKETQCVDELKETEVDTKRDKVGGQEEMDVEGWAREEASQLEELAAVMEQVRLLKFIENATWKCHRSCMCFLYHATINFRFCVI